MASRRVLIIDDEEGIRSSLALILGDEGYEASIAPDADRGLELAHDGGFDVILCDLRMPGRSGLEVLPELALCQPQAIILMMSAYGDLEQAVQAVQRGAYDYLAKPFQADELFLTIRKAEERERLKRENRRLQRELVAGRVRRPLIAASASMKEVHDLVERAAEYKTTVLITGESGVGKEVVARSIHELGDRAGGPFIAVNCGAIAESLIESEFFGHARGAYTGADEAKPGLFREADGGTLFLDEVGELPPAMQVKLLRVLQEEEVVPVGEAKAVRVDVRIVAATARDLEDEVERERFRADLYYRLNVFRIRVPPLRERPEDIPVLADHLLQALAQRLGRSIEPASAEVMAALRSYGWPGNVRELENCLERALILAREESLTPDLLPFTARPSKGEPAALGPSPPGDLSIKRQTRLLEDRLIRRALSMTGGNRTQAARILEISARALQYKIKEYGIEPLNPNASRADSAPS